MGTYNFFLACSLFLGVSWFGLCWGDEDAYYSTSVAPMERNDKEALYSAIQGFVGEWWNGADLYPDPCGWTPIQVSQSIIQMKLTISPTFMRPHVLLSCNHRQLSLVVYAEWQTVN